jgi:non-specific serine/threonine protein kinase/serine/threonine-protein kinase
MSGKMNKDSTNDKSPPDDQHFVSTESGDVSGRSEDPKGSGGGSFKSSPASRIGEVIGRYKLRQLLGEGGFGEVYVARHTRTNRVVAIKLIRHDKITPKALKRFEVETEAMKRLGHPNVAKIYQGGKTDAGEPYLAIEFVEGVPLIEYCDNRRHSINERLELFLQVCAGVQHIHSNGLIHRDLSPDNILVTEEKSEDGKTYPVPKIIDMGVASAIDEDINLAQSLSLSVDFGRMVGKFAYMSPEMAEGAKIRPDIRTDIFSLGVILYELITGVQPLSDETLRDRALHELVKSVAKVERPAPSTAYSRLDAETAEKIRLARNIPTEKEIRRRLNGRLRHLPMTALRLDRNKRYTTIAAFANDIENYLNDRDYAQAAEEPRLDRMLRNLRRHKVPYAAAAIVLCTLILGIIGTTIGMNRARNAEAEAKAESKKAQAAVAFLQTWLSSADPSEVGPDVNLATILDRVGPMVRFIFWDHPETEAAVHTTIGKNYRSLLLYELAEEHFAAALEIRKDNLGEEHPDTLSSMYSLAGVRRRQGHLEEAESLTVDVLEIRRRILGEEHPSTLNSLKELAWIHQNKGNLVEAERLKRQVLEARERIMGEKDGGTQKARGSLANLLLVQGRVAEAKGLYRSKGMPSLGIEKWYQGGYEAGDRGGTILIFWETWCPYCEVAIPTLQELYAKYQERGLQVIGLTRLKDSTDEKVRDYIKDKKVTYPIAKVNREAYKYFNVHGVPTAVAVKDGVVVCRWSGSQMRVSEAIIDTLVGDSDE